MPLKSLLCLLLRSEFAKINIGFTLGNCLIRAISFLAIPIFTYLLSVEDYGRVTTFFAYQAIIGLFTGLTLHASILSANQEFPGRINDYLSSITTLQITVFSTLFCLLGILAACGLIPAHFTFFSAALLLLLTLASSIQASFRQYLSIHYDYKSTLLINLSALCANILFSIFLILLLFSSERYIGRIVGATIAASVVSAYILVRIYKKSKPHLNWKFVRFGCGYSTPVIAHGLSRELISQFPKIVIQIALGNFAVGLYGFAFTIAAIPQLIGSSFDTVWSAWFFNHFENNRKAIRVRAIAYLMVFSSLLLILIAIAPEMVFLLAPSRYSEASEIVIPALMCAYTLFLFYYPGAVEYYKKRTKLIALASAAAAVIHVALILFFVPRFGYRAAVYVTLATYLVYVAFHSFAAHRLVPDLYDYWNMGSLIAITATAALISQFSLHTLAIRLISCSIALFLIIFFNRTIIRDYLQKAQNNCQDRPN